jgi:hypothetical protein
MHAAISTIIIITIVVVINRYYYGNEITLLTGTENDAKEASVPSLNLTLVLTLPINHNNNFR